MVYFPPDLRVESRHGVAVLPQPKNKPLYQEMGQKEGRSLIFLEISSGMKSNEYDF